MHGFHEHGDVLLTAAEHAAYQAELAQLRRRREREVPAQLREARTFVAADAIEEILQIQDRQAALDSRIAALEQLLGSAQVAADVKPGSAAVGCVVEVEDLDTGRRARYRLVGAGRTSDGASVSARSPVGQAVLGRVPGDVVAVELPSGRSMTLRIVDVRSP